MATQRTCRSPQRLFSFILGWLSSLLLLCVFLSVLPQWLTNQLRGAHTATNRGSRIRWECSKQSCRANQLVRSWENPALICRIACAEYIAETLRDISTVSLHTPPYCPTLPVHLPLRGVEESGVCIGSQTKHFTISHPVLFSVEETTRTSVSHRWGKSV